MTQISNAMLRDDILITQNEEGHLYGSVGAAEIVLAGPPRKGVGASPRVERREAGDRTDGLGRIEEVAREAVRVRVREDAEGVQGHEPGLGIDHPIVVEVEVGVDRPGEAVGDDQGEVVALLERQVRHLIGGAEREVGAGEKEQAVGIEAAGQRHHEFHAAVLLGRDMRIADSTFGY